MTSETLFEKVWNYVKANPGRTAGECAAGLGIETHTTSACLSAMERRKMVYSAMNDKEFQMFKGRIGVRKVKHYTVNTATFVMLRAPRRTAPKKSHPARAHRERIPKAALKPATPAATLNVDSLSLGEARELYLKLKQVFG